MAAIAADLRRGQTDDRGTPEQRAAFLQVINADRIGHGIAPMTECVPEEGFYERARSLGMARVDR